MKIALATPLYPPDIEEPAPYVKELARRLAKNHEVTVVAYAHLPEAIPGVRIIAISKRYPLPIRLLAYTFALLKAARVADVLYAQNGASVELPAGIAARMSSRPLFMRLGDVRAHGRAAAHPVLGALERFALRRARTVEHSPLPRPEILPLSPRPEAQLVAYENSWAEHLRQLEGLFTNAT